jgi:hypothetical protein
MSGGYAVDEGKSPERRAREMARAAGWATIVAGLLTAVYAVLFNLLVCSEPARLDAAVALMMGAALILSGIGVLRRSGAALWITIIMVAGVLGLQLWTAYSGYMGSEGVSIYLLTVPLVILIVNTLAVGTVRRLAARGEG